MSTEHSVTRLLQNYLAALSGRNIDVIDRLSGRSTLFEIPFIKPGRLLGNAEIVKAHREIFTNLQTIDFSLCRTESSNNHAIGEGELRFRRSGDDSKILPAAIVAETDGENLRRISLYCDARNLRLWSDKSIM